MKVGLSADHRGYKLKEELKKYLVLEQYQIVDYGTYNPDTVDYPDYGIKLGEGIRDNEIDLGIVICGTGIGISIACNKVKKVRCARIVSVEEAEITRIHNNANVIALNESMSFEDAKEIVNKFLKTEYIPEERFERRIEKINKYEGE